MILSSASRFCSETKLTLKSAQIFHGDFHGYVELHLQKAGMALLGYLLVFISYGILQDLAQ